MKIPEHLKQPGMTPEQKKRVAAIVNKCRKELRKAPAFENTTEATKAAVQMAKEDQYSFPSVWKEPEDVGEKHAVVHTQLREKAQNAGYTEEVDEQKIFDMANGRGEDNIEEVEDVD